MKIADFRIQTTQPDVPTTSSVVGVYADASGSLVSLNAAGIKYNVGQLFTGSVRNNSVGALASTVAMTNPITGILTGAVYMLPVVGPSGQLLAIPAWARV